MPGTALLAHDPTCPHDPAGEPRVFTSGHGAYLHDADGKRWIDLDNARGSVLLGHADPSVTAAVSRAAAGGSGAATGWSPLLDAVIGRLASLLGGEVVGLYRTGTAALRSAATAVRAARARQLGTGQPLLLSAGYHGYDPMWWPGEAPLVPNSDAVVDFFFDLDVLADWLADPRKIAALVISPDHLYLPPSWYVTARELAQQAGVPIVADEVKTGLRYQPGLSAAMLEPAVWIVAKGLANGAPVAAVGGDATLLRELREVSYTSYFEPVVLAAADATLERVATGIPQQEIAKNGGAFVAHARAALAAAGLPIEIAGDGHLFQFVCAGGEVAQAFHAACADQGLLLYEGDNQAPSAALADDALADACQRISLACSALAGRWRASGIGERARYAAAWHAMDGLPALPRTRERTVELIGQLWDE